jgi:hypothetical protein
MSNVNRPSPSTRAWLFCLRANSLSSRNSIRAMRSIYEIAFWSWALKLAILCINDSFSMAKACSLFFSLALSCSLSLRSQAAPSSRDRKAVRPSSFFLLPVNIEQKPRIITTTTSSAEKSLDASCSCFRGYRQLSGGSHGNIEEEQRADVRVCCIEGKQDFVESKINACPTQRRGLGPDASAQQRQEVTKAPRGKYADQSCTSSRTLHHGQPD